MLWAFLQEIDMAKAKIQKKYTAGLGKSTTARRKAAFRRRIEGKEKGASRFKKVAGDAKAKTKPSRYTLSLGKLRDEIRDSASRMEKGSQDDRFIRAVAKVTKIPQSIIDQVFRKGQAAWAVGHRPGATQSHWARARVYYFLQKGKTVTKGPDEALYIKAKKALDKKGTGIRLK